MRGLFNCAIVKIVGLLSDLKLDKRNVHTFGSSQVRKVYMCEHTSVWLQLDTLRKQGDIQSHSEQNNSNLRGQVETRYHCLAILLCVTNVQLTVFT